MLKIRLQRTGRVHEPTFRLVLTDSKNSTKSGKTLEVLGSHDFRKDNTKIEADRVKYWMSKGAQVSDTVHNLLISHKVIDGKKKNVLPKKTVPKKEEPAAEVSAPAPEISAETASAEDSKEEEAKSAESPKEAPPVDEAPQT
jgi:small subunit ribosomal protein S16